MNYKVTYMLTSGHEGVAYEGPDKEAAGHAFFETVKRKDVRGVSLVPGKCNTDSREDNEKSQPTRSDL